MTDPVVDIRGLSIDYRATTRSKIVSAVKNVDLSVGRGRTVGLVGESGSGKSSLGGALLGLAPVSSGAIHFDGVDITSVTGSQANAWRSKGLEISVAVNLSMQNMLDLRLPNDLARLLTSWRLPAGSLELEITESTIMADHRRATTILSRLSKMGVRLSIDDFGTGYSSLAYLQELPVDAIKIDKSFVMEMHEDAGNATIVQSTVDLGHNLGLEVVAEGVETVESYNTLAKLGCDYAQGYFLSKPLSPEKMSIWLEVFSGMATDAPSIGPKDIELDQWSITAPVAPPIDDEPQPARHAEPEGDSEVV